MKLFAFATLLVAALAGTAAAEPKLRGTDGVRTAGCLCTCVCVRVGLGYWTCVACCLVCWVSWHRGGSQGRGRGEDRKDTTAQLHLNSTPPAYHPPQVRQLQAAVMAGPEADKQAPCDEHNEVWGCVGVDILPDSAGLLGSIGACLSD